MITTIQFILTLMIFSPNGETSVAQTQMPSLEVCLKSAQEFLAQEQEVLGAPALAASCLVVYPPKKGLPL